MRPGPELATALALLAAAPAWPAPAGEAVSPGSGGALAVSLDPAELVLGRDASAELRISAPPEVEDLTLSASVGKVEGLRRLPGGGFTARYRPPPERFPQVAIVAALARTAAGTLDGWRAVPLAGQGDARVPGEPGSEVSLSIGDSSFGPGRVGSDGVAVIPVVVPPGVREGHRGFTPVELRVPETTLLHAVADRTTVRADRSETVRVFAYVVAPHGAARKGDPPVVEVSCGTLALQPREPGAWVGTWTLPAGPPAEERATVRLEGFPASKAVVRVTTQPGPASSITLAVDRTTLPAGEAEEVLVTARAMDAMGNLAVAQPALSVDAGWLAAEDAGPGQARARLRVDAHHQGREQVVVSAYVPGTSASAVQPVALAPGPAARAVLDPARTAFRTDGRAEAVLALEAWDAFQNPAAGTPRVTASTGTATVEPAGTGRWTVRYRPQAVAQPTSARLAAELGGAQSAADFLLLPPASAELAFLAAGGGLAGVSSGVAGGQLLVGAELPVRQWLPLPVDQSLGLRLELDGFQGGRSVAGGGRETQGGVAALAGPVLKGVLSRTRWFASATGGLLVSSARGPLGPSRTGAGPAMRLGLGLAVPVRRTAPFVEVGFLGAGGPAGGVRALSLSLGVRLDLVHTAEAGPGG